VFFSIRKSQLDKLSLAKEAMEYVTTIKKLFILLFLKSKMKSSMGKMLE
jgi:hypothetical protein